jgi:hypothetical protein
MLQAASCIFLATFALLAGAFVPELPAATHRVARLHSLETKSTNGIFEDYRNGVDSWKRRLVMIHGLVWWVWPEVASARDDPGSDQPNLDALMDLPPVTEGCVRLFLCRHGQTENNRLRKVQGARIDLPINENGVQQAKNLGKALGRLTPKPSTFYSSNLKRAKMTAEIAVSEVQPDIRVRQLDSLGEVDFGPVAEGRPVSLARAGMQATYAAWATGNIDFRPEGGEGESGRDVSTTFGSELNDSMAG